MNLLVTATLKTRQQASHHTGKDTQNPSLPDPPQPGPKVDSDLRPHRSRAASAHRTKLCAPEGLYLSNCLALECRYFYGLLPQFIQTLLPPHLFREVRGFLTSLPKVISPHHCICFAFPHGTYTI